MNRVMKNPSMTINYHDGINKGFHYAWPKEKVGSILTGMNIIIPMSTDKASVSIEYKNKNKFFTKDQLKKFKDKTLIELMKNVI